MVEGLRTAEEVVMKVIIFLAYGCPTQAIVHAFGVDERTVADWQRRAGKHCQQVHEALVQDGKVETHHVQADAHSRQRMENDCMDGFGYGGVDALMAGRSRERAEGQDLGRSLAAPGSRLLPDSPSAFDRDRWLESVCAPCRRF